MSEPKFHATAACLGLYAFGETPEKAKEHLGEALRLLVDTLIGIEDYSLELIIARLDRAGLIEVGIDA